MMQHEAIKLLLRILSWRPDLNLMVILIAALCIVNRTENIWQHRDSVDLSETSLVSQANAAPHDPQMPIPAKEPAPIEQSPKDDNHTPAKKQEFDPLNLNENEVKIIAALANKKPDPTVSDDRAKLVEKEGIVKTAEHKLNEQIKQLESAKTNLDQAKQSLTKEEQENLDQMVKIYEKMKPAEAADILNKLEITALTQIIKVMNPKKAALILGAMDQAKVRLVTLVMLQYNKATLAAIAQKQFDVPDKTPKITPHEKQS